MLSSKHDDVDRQVFSREISEAYAVF